MNSWIKSSLTFKLKILHDSKVYRKWIYKLWRVTDKEDRSQNQFNIYSWNKTWRRYQVRLNIIWHFYKQKDLERIGQSNIIIVREKKKDIRRELAYFLKLQLAERLYKCLEKMGIEFQCLLLGSCSFVFFSLCGDIYRSILVGQVGLISWESRSTEADWTASQFRQVGWW